MSEERKYNGWLVDESLVKRSFAVMGHYMFAQLLIGCGLLVLLLFFMFMGLLFGAAM